MLFLHPKKVTNLYQRPREKGFVLWGHCQNILDDPPMHVLMRVSQV